MTETTPNHSFHPHWRWKWRITYRVFQQVLYSINPYCGYLEPFEAIWSYLRSFEVICSYWGQLGIFWTNHASRSWGQWGYFDPLLHLKLSIEVSCFGVIEVVSNLYAELGWSPCMYSFSLQWLYLQEWWQLCWCSQHNNQFPRKHRQGCGWKVPSPSCPAIEQIYNLNSMVC